MQKSILFCCFAAIILYSDAAAINQASDQGEKGDGVQEQQRVNDIEDQIRNYVNQMRAREQLATMRQLRQKAILAAIDPREYYEQPAAQNVIRKFLHLILIICKKHW